MKFVEISPKKFIVLILIITIAIILLFLLVKSSTSGHKKLPPLNDASATYILRKDRQNYMIEYRNRNGYFCCLMIGRSDIDLENYVNHSIIFEGDYARDTSGYFALSDTQCIKNTCHKLFASDSGINTVPGTIVINLKSLF